MFQDPLTMWADGFPYDLLSPAGITPDSSQREVRDAAFTLMAQGPMAPAMRQAWDTLRQPERRLAVDFFMLEEDRLCSVGPGIAGQLLLAERAMEGATLADAEKLARVIRELKEAHHRGDHQQVEQTSMALQVAVARLFQEQAGKQD